MITQGNLYVINEEDIDIENDGTYYIYLPYTVNDDDNNLILIIQDYVIVENGVKSEVRHHVISSFSVKFPESESNNNINENILKLTAENYNSSKSRTKKDLLKSFLVAFKEFKKIGEDK